jgi:hypothetical protein
MFRSKSFLVLPTYLNKNWMTFDIDTFLKSNDNNLSSIFFSAESVQ